MSNNFLKNPLSNSLDKEQKEMIEIEIKRLSGKLKNMCKYYSENDDVYLHKNKSLEGCYVMKTKTLEHIIRFFLENAKGIDLKPDFYERTL